MKQSDLLIANFAATAIRVVMVIAIGFFLVRIQVNQMGMELFGLFTTIGASGAMLNLLTNTLQLSISRELGISVGKADPYRLAQAFSSSFFIQLFAGSCIGILGILLAGLLSRTLTIPPGYENTAWICLILTFIQLWIAILASPFGGMIRAHQHLRTMAVLELANYIVLFVAAVFMIYWPGDKLLFYVSASLVCNASFQFATVYVALQRYRESRPRWGLISRESAGSIFRYGSMAMVGGIGQHIRRYGIAIILNIYFGNLVTAANGIAIRFSSLVARIVGVIVPVVQPAMNSNEGAGNEKVVHRLIMLTSTIGLAIVIPIALPILLDTETILTFWLDVEPPPYAELFAQLITLTFVVSMLTRGHTMAMHARGVIGRMTLVNQGLVALGILVGAVIACPSRTNPWLLPAGELAGLIAATWAWVPWWVARKLGFSNRAWMRYTLLPFVLMLFSSAILAWLIVSSLESSLLRAFLLAGASGFSCFAILWTFALSDAERQNLLGSVRRSIQNALRALRHSTGIVKN